jgi:hypothetical protein
MLRSTCESCDLYVIIQYLIWNPASICVAYLFSPARNDTLQKLLSFWNFRRRHLVFRHLSSYAANSQRRTAHERLSKTFRFNLAWRLLVSRICFERRLGLFDLCGECCITELEHACPTRLDIIWVNRSTFPAEREACRTGSHPNFPKGASPRGGDSWSNLSQ